MLVFLQLLLWDCRAVVFELSGFIKGSVAIWTYCSMGLSLAMSKFMAS